MKRPVIPYNPKLKQLARLLRKNSTLSEILLWKHLRGKQMKGYDFHRQKPLNEYIIDFFCNELMLAIEIDGSSHELERAYERDQERQQQLESLGISFLRFDDRMVKQDMKSVLLAIELWIEAYEEASNQKIDELEKLYTEKLRLEGPVQYWTTRAEELQKAGRWWAGGLTASIIITAATILVVLFIPPDYFSS